MNRGDTRTPQRKHIDDVMLQNAVRLARMNFLHGKDVLSGAEIAEQMDSRFLSAARSGAKEVFRLKKDDICYELYREDGERKLHFLGGGRIDGVYIPPRKRAAWAA